MFCDMMLDMMANLVMDETNLFYRTLAKVGD
jgi:hypothetical protein